MLAGLLGSDPRMQRLYQESPEFHHGVRLVVRTLPRFVELMATEAEQEQRRRRQMEQMYRTMPARVPPPGATKDPHW